MIVYHGTSTMEPRRSLPRGWVSSPRSWFVELWLRGRYVGLAR